MQNVIVKGQNERVKVVRIHSSQVGLLFAKWLYPVFNECIYMYVCLSDNILFLRKHTNIHTQYQKKSAEALYCYLLVYLVSLILALR